MSTKTYTGETQELHLLAEDVKMWFQGHGYQVEAASNDTIHIVQARRTSARRKFFSTNQAFYVMIEGKPTCYTVEVGTGIYVEDLAGTGIGGLINGRLTRLTGATGKWVWNLAGTGINSLFTGGLTGLTSAAGAASIKKSESDLWNWLDLRNVKAQSAPAPAPAPAVAPAPTPAAAAPVGNIPEKIKKLAELRDMGVLTLEEFEAKKKELLSRM
jgi:hypothetical protein